MHLLIYIASLNFRSAIYMTIENKCRYIKLTSPVHYIKDTNCYMQFPQQVDSRNIMKANFMTGIDQYAFGGALLYRLRWKESDASMSVHLLVIWKYNSDWIDSHALLVELENTLDWDKDKLKGLHDVYDIRRDIGSRLGERWLSNDTKLRTECGISCRGFKMEIIISEASDLLLLIRPPRVDPNR
jgi:hypothetical protein